jgi:hypothetical protein
MLDVKGRGDGEGDGKEKKGPGSSWKTKKGHEEMSRAMESLVDRYMIGRTYGDPLDPASDPRLKALFLAMKAGREKQSMS